MTKELYCPYCGDAQGGKLTCCDEADFIPYDDLDEDMKDPEELDICSNCNGSGSGRYEGTKCYSCNGQGVR